MPGAPDNDPAPVGMPNSSRLEFAAALLAGGASSRMGADKALLDWHGVPLWRAQIGKLIELNPDRLLLSCREEQQLKNVFAEFIFDLPDNPGPMGAIARCLEVARMPLLVLAVDMPAMTVDFLRSILGQCDHSPRGLVCRAGHGFEPLCAVYPTEALATLRDFLGRGNPRMQDAVAALVAADLMQVRALQAGEVPLFFNTNTPEEYAWTTSSPRRIELTRLERGTESRSEDFVAREEPLEIRVEGRSVAVTMRTPGHDEELAAGFLLTEGVVKSAADIFEISPCPSTAEGGNVIDVLLTTGVSVNWESLTRHVFASSSCGVCGKATLDSVFASFPPVNSSLKISPALLQALPEKLRGAQETFARTGGLHASAIFDGAGNLRVLREDVGRHNALDKALGHALRAGWLPMENHILMVSGRVSFELMQKALAGGIPVVAAISAPSSLAVEFAQRSGQTLVGFLRGDKMNVYANGERVTTGK